MVKVGDAAADRPGAEVEGNGAAPLVRATQLPPLEEVIARIGEHLDALDTLEEPQRQLVIELLDELDLLHRAGLERFVHQVNALGGRGLLPRLAADPTVHALLELYDLAPDASADPTAPHPRIDGPTGSSEPHAAGLHSVGPATPGHVRWVDLGPGTDLAEGMHRGLLAEGVPVLLVRFDDRVMAYRNACPPGSPLVIDHGERSGSVLTCPWHGCRYDLRDGTRLDASGALERLPVSSADGSVQVAVGIAVAE